MSKVDVSFSVNWNTVKDCQRTGFGSDLLRRTLRYCVDVYGKPERMYYEWDKVNQYVMDWLVRVFGAEHQSYEIYTLDVDKVLEFVC